MNKHLIALICGVGLVGTVSFPVMAQQKPCGQRDIVLERLASKYGETRRSIGLARDNRIVETYASDETGTWTIVMTLPTGVTCLIAAGASYQPTQNEQPSSAHDL